MIIDATATPVMAQDVIRYVREGRNVIVMRTFSKTYGLAGLRIGYGIAPEACIQLMQRVRQPFNTTAIAQAAAVAAAALHWAAPEGLGVAARVGWVVAAAAEAPVADLREAAAVEAEVAAAAAAVPHQVRQHRRMVKSPFRIRSPLVFAERTSS